MWYDARQGLEVGDWVELVDDHWAPLGTPAPLMQVQGISLATRQVTLQDTDGRPRLRPEAASTAAALGPAARQPRRPTTAIAVEQADRKWFELEDGVQIRFEAPVARYERGDYWLIPARTATSGVLWPQSRDEPPAPLAVPPDGPLRYLAPLALVKKMPGNPVDLRVLFGYPAGEHHGPPEPSQAAAQREVPAGRHDDHHQVGGRELSRAVGVHVRARSACSQ